MEDYNQEPVFYCRHCLSLRIMGVGKTDESYCDDCGNTVIETTDIHTWENMWEERYGFKYLTSTNN
jgi:hypothetical protein